MRVVLASKSPRRRELLKELFSEFDIIVSEADENVGEEISPVSAVEILAVRKGAAVLPELAPSDLVISSDTLVELDGKPLGKPQDENEAYKMLRSLSGRTHNVHTGVAVHHMGAVYSGVATSCVHFRELSDEEIFAYIDSGEPFDKAGAYGIQGAAGAFVKDYDGDFDTIVGLSLRLTRELVENCIPKKLM